MTWACPNTNWPEGFARFSGPAVLVLPNVRQTLCSAFFFESWVR